MQKRGKNWWGFETNSIDKTVRPQDDFYAYANGNWIKNTKIPEEESRWGAFITLRVETEHQLKALVDKLLKGKRHTKGSPEQMVSDYYRSAIDMKVRNKLGLQPLTELLEEIRSIKNKNELLETVARLHVQGVSGFWGTLVDQDSKDSTKYILTFWQGGLSLPDRDYYLLDKPEQTRVRDAYVVHIKRLMALAGRSDAKARAVASIVMNIETKLAQASMKKEDTRDPEKVYHKMSFAGLIKIAPAVNWKKYVAQTGAQTAKQLMISQPKFFAFASKLIATTPLEDLKIYLEWHTLNDSASLLSEEFVHANFDFYATVLSGVKVMKPLWRRALAATNGALGETLGKVYVAAYFPPASKKAMDSLVNDLFAAYTKRILKLDWMTPATKKKALVKLRAMNRKIGYPNTWKSYKGLVVASDDYFGNAVRSSVFEHYRNMKKLGHPIDRGEWFMYPQTVNAYFAPNLNDIVFPAAILQWPFFDAKADAAMNYASIGSVIGHEITHGFDDSGAKFDSKGNMKNWWSKTDVKKFTAKTKPFINQANKECVLEEVYINGQLTLGENMADSGGLAIAFDAYQHHLSKVGRKDIQGLTPEQRFFYAYAQQEQELKRPEILKMFTLVDPHAPPEWRINGPLSNFEPFYKTFGVKKGDKLYRDPKTRAQIW